MKVIKRLAFNYRFFRRFGNNVIESAIKSIKMTKGQKVRCYSIGDIKQ